MDETCQTTDLELLDAWRAGDQAAAQTLLGRHEATLQRFFRNKTSYGADDLVQLTFMAALKNRDNFEGRSSFRSYLLSIARYTLYEHYRSMDRRQQVFEFNTVTLYDLSPSPSTHAAQRDEERLLLEALRRIPINLQIALELHYWEDLSGPELAEVLDVPVDTVYSRLRKAKELLRKKLKVIASSPELLHQTQENLGGWARSVREQVGLDSDAADSELT